MTYSTQQKSSLGMGLSSLLGENNDSSSVGDILRLPLSSVSPGKFQPRKNFDNDNHKTLVESIKLKGILQPILVRSTGEEKFEIIAGERRWRAAKDAGLEHVPAILKECTDKEALELGLIENVQRHDLNPIEEAEAYQKLMVEFEYKQKELSEVIGKSRSHIANVLRLNSLSEKVKEYVRNDRLNFGQARAIAGHNNADEIAEKIIKQRLNVRQVEALLTKKKKDKLPSFFDEEFSSSESDKELIEQQLKSIIGLPVHIELQQSGGKINIEFKDMQELDALLQRMMRLSGFTS